MRVSFPVLAGFVLAEENYDGFKVLRASWDNSEHTELVGSILERFETMNLWEPESLENIKYTQAVDFMVSNEEASVFREQVGNFSEIKTLIDDAGKIINEQKVKQKRATEGLRGATYPYDQFLTYLQLEEWILGRVSN